MSWDIRFVLRIVKVTTVVYLSCNAVVEPNTIYIYILYLDARLGSMRVKVTRKFYYMTNRGTFVRYLFCYISSYTINGSTMNTSN